MFCARAIRVLWLAGGLTLWVSCGAPAESPSGNRGTKRVPPAAVCDRLAFARADAVVYDDYPRFHSGSGYVVGHEIDRLAEGQTVAVCQEVEIGVLGTDTKVWYEIEFAWSVSNELRRGWLFADRIALEATECARMGRALEEAVVYSDYPRFYSGSGWVTGSEIGRLSEGERVAVCQTQEVGFLGMDTKVWYEIRLGSSPSGDTTRGWVFSEQIALGADTP
jgi:hypothetical protein